MLFRHRSSQIINWSLELLVSKGRWKSTLTSTRPLPVKYTVEELKIPVPHGHLAAKCWQADSSSTSDPSSSRKYSPVLCVHGWLDNAGSFDAIVPLIIKPNMTVVALDLPGHGFSSPVPWSYYDAFNDGFLSMHRVIRHFDWKKVTLMGHGYGSELCYVMAGVYPELTERYIALDNLGPSVLDPVKTIRRATISLFEYEKIAADLPKLSYTYKELLRGYYGARKEAFDLSLPACETLLQRGATKQEDGTFAYSHDFRVAIPFGFERFSEEHIQELSNGIKSPVCVIKAEAENDPGIRDLLHKAVETIQENSEKFEFHIVTGPHHAHLMEPHLLAPLVSKFLDGDGDVVLDS